MDDSQRDEILWRLDERTKRVDGHLDRIDRRLEEVEMAVDDHEQRINENENELDLINKTTKTLGGTVLTTISALIAKFAGILKV